MRSVSVFVYSLSYPPLFDMATTILFADVGIEGTDKGVRFADPTHSRLLNAHRAGYRSDMQAVVQSAYLG